MFTGEARAINGLDTSVDINVEGKGKVKAIYRQTTEEMSTSLSEQTKQMAIKMGLFCL